MDTAHKKRLDYLEGKGELIDAEKKELEALRAHQAQTSGESAKASQPKVGEQKAAEAPKAEVKPETPKVAKK